MWATQLPALPALAEQVLILCRYKLVLIHSLLRSTVEQQPQYLFLILDSVAAHLTTTSQLQDRLMLATQHCQLQLV